MDAADAIDGDEQLVDRGLGCGVFGRELEGFGGPVEDGDALWTMPRDCICWLGRTSIT
ncbi:hypothetical protein ACFV0O_00315 [Kitasatospora sp. NPDC059577]|uniref:hypothetical protein n=1 Tax=Kitasatospora sp. NPDC059577 TaxID=3346873 RepID=UPI00369E5C3D